MSVHGPNGFFGNEGGEKSLQTTLPRTGRYEFEIGPCFVWGNKGRVEICADPVRSAAYQTRPTPQKSDPDPGINIVHIPGRCEKFTLGDIPLTCDKILYTHLEKTGRTTFNIPTEQGALGLSGGNDIQPTLERYVLSVDLRALRSQRHRFSKCV